MRYFLPQLLANITGKKRYMPVIKWSNKSWTHNFFRFFEMVFWRRVGIRAELSSSYNNGVVTYSFHTIESVIAHIESMIRGLVPRRIPLRIYIPVLQLNTGMSSFKVPASPYLFAIAFDVTSKNGTAEETDPSWSHTCTGSDLTLMDTAAVRNQGDSLPTSMVYNSVSMTNSVEQGEDGTMDVNLSGWYLANPATGSNTLSWIAGTSWGIACSYTGTDTSDPVGGTGTSSATSATPSVSITTDTDNSFIVCGYVGNGNTGATGDDLTDRTTQLFNAPFHFGAMSDEEVATAGATSGTWDSTNSAYHAVGTELHAAPAAGAAVVTPQLLTLGVG